MTATREGIDPRHARAALFAIHPGCDREEWHRIGRAAIAAGLTVDDVDEWSSGASNYTGARDVHTAFRSIKPEGGTGPGTLWRAAMAAGWKPPRGDGRQGQHRRHHAWHGTVSHAPATPRRSAVEVWGRCEPASGTHGYIAAKLGTPEGLRVVPQGDPLTVAGLPVAGCLVVPVLDVAGEPVSLQFIASPDMVVGWKAAGKPGKLNLPGASMGHDGRFTIGQEDPDGVMFLVEGIGQAWACWKATGCPSVVCFGWGRVRTVAKALRQQYAAARLVLVPDAGKESDAERIAAELGAAVVKMPDGNPANFDANDYAQACGFDALKTLLSKPHMSAHSASDMPTDRSAARWCDARDGTSDTEPLTELGNARRLVAAHGQRLRYVPEVAGWLVWTDDAWKWSPDGAAVRALASRLPETIYMEGARHMEDGAHFARWARTSQKAQTIAAAVGLLADIPQVRLPIASIDSDPWLCGLDSGRQVLDLRIGKARPTTPADLVTKGLRVSHVGTASQAVRWCAFLAQVLQEDVELLDWLQRWCGYLLTGSTREQVLVFCFGHGANGKSVFAEVLRFIVGDYARTVANETLTEVRRGAGAASPDLAGLVGARLALTTETEDGAALAESLVKTMTAGDALSVRPLYRAPFDFVPSFKLLMLGNHRPVIRGTDLGIWRRMRLVPFMRTFAPEERDPELADKLKAEAPHILAWMLEGCIEWQRRGLSDVPGAVAAQTEDYRQEMDTLGQWLTECCTTGSAAEEASRELYGSYREWAQGCGLRPMSTQAFGRRLTERGFADRKSHGVRIRLGLMLRPPTTAINGHACART